MRLLLPLLLFTLLPLAAIAGNWSDPAALEFKDGVNVVYHIKVSDTRDDGVAKGLAELRHLIRIYDEQGIGMENRSVCAVFDADAAPFVLSDPAYSKLGIADTNPNAKLIAELVEAGVNVEVCGQRLKRDGMTKDDVLPGVHVALGGQPRVIDLQLQGYAYFRF